MSLSLSTVRRSGLCLALALGGLAAPGPAAIAQDATTTTPAPTAEGITVTAPREVERSPTTGAPIETVTMTRVVPIGDLNLSIPSGTVLLNQRVEAAARDACRELESKFPIGTPNAMDCARAAAASAEDQIAAAKAAAATEAGGR